jgi:hypothetical protein
LVCRSLIIEFEQRGGGRVGAAITRSASRLLKATEMSIP